MQLPFGCQGFLFERITSLVQHVLPGRQSHPGKQQGLDCMCRGLDKGAAHAGFVYPETGEPLIDDLGVVPCRDTAHHAAKCSPVQGRTLQGTEG